MRQKNQHQLLQSWSEGVVAASQAKSKGRNYGVISAVAIVAIADEIQRSRPSRIQPRDRNVNTYSQHQFSKRDKNPYQ